MALTLTIENQTSLPDGGPLSVTIQGKRGIDIGRDSHLDWTLPDPTRFVSGKHCEVRYAEGGYWLHDVSTNGTFLNGADHRMQGPHRLRHGDRFVVGTYIVAVTLDPGDEGAALAPQAAPAAVAHATNDQELWADLGSAPPPIDPRELKPPASRKPGGPDFLDWAVDLPAPVRGPAAPSTRSAPEPVRDAEMDWAVGPSSAAPQPPPAAVAIPAPRRPAGPAAQSPWDEGAPAQPPSLFAAEQPAAKAHAPPQAPASPSPDPAPVGQTGSPASFLRQLAAAADLPEDVFSQIDQAELARQLGGMLRIAAENLKQLLSARAQAKQMSRSASHTMIQAVDNNPLKFAPSAQEALRIMLSPRTQSYLDGPRAFEQSFTDLKRHQIKTYSAMQHALRMLMSEFAPQAIEQSTPGEKSLAGLLASNKARLWDAYVARWQARVRQDGAEPIEAFMLYFAEFYDRDEASDAAIRTGAIPFDRQGST